MASHKGIQKRERARTKLGYSQRISPQKRFIIKACLILFLAAGIFQMIKPLRAQRHYRYAKNTLDAVIQKKLNPKEHPEVIIRAIHELQRGLRFTPNNGEMWTCMGDLFYFTDQNRSSLSSYRTALRYFRSPSLYINMGVICAKLNMYDEAEEALNWALAFSPDQGQAYKALKLIKALRLRNG